MIYHDGAVLWFSFFSMVSFIMFSFLRCSKWVISCQITSIWKASVEMAMIERKVIMNSRKNQGKNTTCNEMLRQSSRQCGVRRVMALSGLSGLLVLLLIIFSQPFSNVLNQHVGMGTSSTHDGLPHALQLQYTLHDPIMISSDADWSNYTFPGSGTPSDPYIISSLNITKNANTTADNGI